MLDINKVANKMRLLGDEVCILTDNTLIQSNKVIGKCRIISIKNNEVETVAEYKEINKVKKSNICITKDNRSLYGIINDKGIDIIKPGYYSIDYSTDGVLIVKLTNGLTNITDYTGKDLLEYINGPMKITNTIIGNLISIRDNMQKVRIIKIELENGKVELVNLSGISDTIGDSSYYIRYDRIIVLNKPKQITIKLNERMGEK